MITLYSTNCPKCKILEQKLNQKGVDYTLCTDIDVMEEKGFMAAPMLEKDGEVMDFGTAIKWINEV